MLTVITLSGFQSQKPIKLQYKDYEMNYSWHSNQVQESTWQLMLSINVLNQDSHSFIMKKFIQVLFLWIFQRACQAKSSK